jgi:hypothetical protein
MYSLHNRGHQYTLDELITWDIASKLSDQEKYEQMIRRMDLEEERELEFYRRYGSPGEWAALRDGGDPDREDTP